MGLLANFFDSWLEARNPQQALANRYYRKELARSQFRYEIAYEERNRASWLDLGGDGDRHIRNNDLWTIREKSRALERNNIVASSLLDRAEESVVGQGMRLMVSSPDKQFNRDAEERFADWWETEADIRGVMSGQELSSMAYRTSRIDGDVFFIKTSTGQIQPIEADRVFTPTDKADNKLIRHGIEMTPEGRPVRVWIAKETPISAGYFDSKMMTTYPAEHVIMLQHLRRYSMTRGLPVFAQNGNLFSDIEEFINACVIGAKVSVSHVLFIKRAAKQRLGDFDAVTDPGTGKTSYQAKVAPGMIMHGNPGDEASMVGSTQQMVQFGPFVTQLLRFSGLNLGMPLELVSLDFSQTNYSSARAAMLVAHRCNLRHHGHLTRRFFKPIAEWKLSTWISQGVLKPPVGGQYRLDSVKPRMMSIDPQKEAAAKIDQIKAGILTNRDVGSEQGNDWEDQLTQRAIEITKAIELAHPLIAAGVDVSWRDLLVSGEKSGPNTSSASSIDPAGIPNPIQEPTDVVEEE